MRKLSWMLLALVAAPLQAQDAAVEQWNLSDARVAVRFNAGLLRDMGVRLSPAGRPVRDGYVAHEFGVEGRFSAAVPNRNFETVDGGELRLTTGPTLAFKGGSATLVGATVRPGNEPATFVVTAASIRRRTERILGLEFHLVRVAPERLTGTTLVWRGRERVAVSDRERLVTDTEVLREILHRYVTIDRRDAIQRRSMPSSASSTRCSRSISALSIAPRRSSSGIAACRPAMPFTSQSWNARASIAS